MASMDIRPTSVWCASSNSGHELGLFATRDEAMQYVGSADAKHYTFTQVDRVVVYGVFQRNDLDEYPEDRLRELFSSRKDAVAYMRTEKRKRDNRDDEFSVSILEVR